MGIVLITTLSLLFPGRTIDEEDVEDAVAQEVVHETNDRIMTASKTSLKDDDLLNEDDDTHTISLNNPLATTMSSSPSSSSSSSSSPSRTTTATNTTKTTTTTTTTTTARTKRGRDTGTDRRRADHRDWSPHGQLNAMVYAVLIFITLCIVQHEYPGILYHSSVRFFPRETALLFDDGLMAQPTTTTNYNGKRQWKYHQGEKKEKKKKRISY